MKPSHLLILSAFSISLLVILIIGSAFSFVFALTATAATFQSWEFAAIQPSKLGTVEAVDASFKIAHAQYALAHGGCWEGDCYYAAATEWLNAHGCSGCYVNAKEMSFKVKVDYPNYIPPTVVMLPSQPEPWMYSAIDWSGLLTVDNVQRSVFGAQVDYANKHGGCFDHDCTEAAWSEWLRSHGCATCYIQDNQLAFAIKANPRYIIFKDAQAK